MRRAPSRRPPVPHTPVHRRSESPLPPSSPDNRRPLSERPHPSDITRILFIGEIADKRLSKIFVEIFPPPEKIFLHLSALSPIMSNQEDPNYAQIPPHPTASMPLCDGNGNRSDRHRPHRRGALGLRCSHERQSSHRRPLHHPARCAPRHFGEQNAVRRHREPARGHRLCSARGESARRRRPLRQGARDLSGDRNDKIPPRREGGRAREVRASTKEGRRRRGEGKRT